MIDEGTGNLLQTDAEALVNTVNCVALTRLQQVGRLIEGFETPYGMELLSSVHFVAKHEPLPATNEDDAVRLVHAWIDRKKKVLKSEHIRVAWAHLQAEGWLA